MSLMSCINKINDFLNKHIYIDRTLYKYLENTITTINCFLYYILFMKKSLTVLEHPFLSSINIIMNGSLYASLATSICGIYPPVAGLIVNCVLTCANYQLYLKN